MKKGRPQGVPFRYEFKAINSKIYLLCLAPQAHLECREAEYIDELRRSGIPICAKRNKHCLPLEGKVAAAQRLTDEGFPPAGVFNSAACGT